MNTVPTESRVRGFTVIELLIVMAIVAIAAGIAAMMLTTAKRTAGMQESRAVVGATIRRAAASAAKSGATRGLDLWSIPVSSTVRLLSDAPAPLPDEALVLGAIDLQGGTGYPYSNGRNQAVAVVIEDADDPAQTVAIVLGRSATVAEYRLAGSSWEVLK